MNDTGKAMLAMLHANPLDSVHRLVFADWCDENGEEWAAKPLREGRVPLQRLDCVAVEVLKSCRFAPATWDKRFARDLPNDAGRGASLTPRQYLWLWILLRKYRRSVTHDAIRAEAEKRNKPYQAIVAADVVNPRDPNPMPKTRTGRAARKAKASRKVKSFEMPLFD